MRRLLEKISILSFILVLLNITNICIAYASNKNIDTEYEEALVMMKNIGVINDEIEYNSQEKVSREDMAVYTARLLGERDIDVENRYFTDVPSSSYGAGAINYLTACGVLAQSKDHLFYPENDVDLNQVYKILTTVLGYGVYAETNGQYPVGYQLAAKEAKISLPNDSEANFKNIMIAMYRAAQADMYEITNTVNSIKYMNNGETLLSRYHDIYFSKGTVESINGLTTLSGYLADDGYVRISGNVYYMDANIFEPDYLAKYVKYFYTDDKDGTRVKALFSAAKEEDLKINIKNINAISEELISYEGENHRIKNTNLRGMLWIYNGSPLDTEITAVLRNLNKGYVNLIDSDNDGTYDTIAIWDYKNFVVNGINMVTSTLSNKLSGGGTIALEDFENVLIFDEKKNSITLEDISVNNVLSVAASRDKRSVQIIVSTVEFNGTLSEISQQNIAVVIKVNDTDYKIEPSYAEEFNNSKLSVGTVYNYKTDAFGNIAYMYIDRTADNSMKYGYILKGYKSESGEEVIVRMLNQEGNIEDISLDNKVKIDGVRYKNIDSAVAAFPKVYDEDFISKQIIRYELSQENKIKTVDTLILNSQYETEDNSITAVGDESFSWKWYMRGRIGTKAYADGENTLVFKIPDISRSVYEDISEYRVSTVASTLWDDLSVRANLYTSSGRSEYIDVVLERYDNGGITKNTEVIMVEDIFTAANSDGELGHEIVGMSEGAEISVFVPEDISVDNIGEGDLIMFRYGVNNQIVPSNNPNKSDIIMLYDYSKYQGESPSQKDWPGITETATLYTLINDAYYQNYRAETQLSYGTVTDKKGNCIWWSYKDAENADEMFNLTDIPVMVYDSSRRRDVVYRGGIGDIDAANITGTGSKIIFQTYIGIGKAIFVYR